MQFRIFIIVRPGACEFIETMSEYFDVILWTASLREYADPVMDRIDKNRRASRRLFRESCTLLASGLTKDLTILDLNLKDVIIVDVFFLILNFRTLKTLSASNLLMPIKFPISYLTQQTENSQKSHHSSFGSTL
jgi:hypothetical protein